MTARVKTNTNKQMVRIILTILNLMLFIHITSNSHGQRLLTNKVAYLGGYQYNEDGSVLLGIDEERMAFEKEIDSLLDSKGYRQVIDKILIRNDNDVNDMDQHHLSNLGLAYYYMDEYDSAVYYLKTSEIKDRGKINDYHKVLLGISYFNIDLKNVGCAYLKETSGKYLDESEYSFTCLLPSITYVDFPADSCSLNTGIILNPGDHFGVYASRSIGSYVRLNELRYPFLNYGKNNTYTVNIADSGALILEKSQGYCDPKKIQKQRVRIETYSKDNELKDWSGLNETPQADSLWQILDRIELESHEKYDPDTLRAKWSLSGDGEFKITPHIVLEKKDKVWITVQGNVYLDSIGKEIDVDGFGTYSDRMQDESLTWESMQPFVLNKAFGIGSVIVATSSQPNGFSGMSPARESVLAGTRFEARSDGDLQMFLNMKNTTNNTGSFHGEVIVQRKKLFTARENGTQKTLRTTRRKILIPSEDRYNPAYESLYKDTPIQLKVSGKISTELVENIPPSGLELEEYENHKRVSHIKYGAVMYRIGKNGIWKAIEKENHLYQLTAHTNGKLTIAINVNDQTEVQGNFEVSLRKSNRRYL